MYILFKLFSYPTYPINGFILNMLFVFFFNFYWCSILRGVNLKINKKEIVLVRINKRRYEDDEN